MALVNFFPQNVVQAMILVELRKKMVFGSLVKIVNPKNGGSYQYGGLGDVNVGDYNGSDITVQDLDDVKKTLTIDQQKYFAFYYDKVDNKKSALNVFSEFGKKGAYKLALALDTFIATQMASGVTHKETAELGTVALPLIIDESNIIDYVTSIQETMDDAEVPEDGRRLVLPPFATTALAKSNITVASTTDELARTTGYVQKFAGFEIYKSTNLVKTSARVGVQCLAFTTETFLLASLLDEFEMFDKVEKRFAEMMKGLSVYGGALLQPDSGVRGVISKA